MTERNRQNIFDRVQKLFPWNRSATTLTPEQRQLQELYYQSFRFSQGDPNLQTHLFSWLSAHGYLQDLPLTRRRPRHIKKVSPPPEHQNIDASLRRSETRKMYSHFFSARKKTGEKQLQDKLLMDVIVEGMITRDVRYQVGERPGRQDSSEIKPDSIRDLHASYLRRFALHAEPTGTQAFDVLHQEVRANLVHMYAEAVGLRNVRPDDLTSVQRDLLDLEKFWENRHPGERFLPLEVSSEIEATLAKSNAEVVVFKSAIKASEK